MIIGNAVYKDKITDGRVKAFAGLNRTENCAFTQFAVAENITNESYPCLMPMRSPAAFLPGVSDLKAYIVEKSRIIYQSGTTLFQKENDSAEAETLAENVSSDTQKIIKMGERYILFPSLDIYDGQSHLNLFEGTVLNERFQRPRFSALIIQTPTISDNKISFSTSSTYANAYNFLLQFEGYSLNVYSYDVSDGENGILRSVTISGNTVTLTFDGIITSGTPNLVTLAYTPPTLGEAFVCNNRLWGYAGSVIYASALGNPAIFDRYAGLSTDAWTVSVTTVSGFTGGVEYNGHPVFLAEDRIVTVYGSYPAEFQTSETAGNILGCVNGKTAVVLGGALYYLSVDGICRWAGGIPAIISDDCGHIDGTEASTDGRRYCIQTNDGMLLYDTRLGLWERLVYKEGEEPQTVIFSKLQYAYGSIYGVSGDIYKIASVEPSGEALACVGVSGIQNYESEKGKRLMRVFIRAKIAAGSSIKVSVDYDGAGTYAESKTFTGNGEQNAYDMYVTTRRFDHMRLKLEGNGEWVIFAVTLEYEKE